jgi:tetratricopeptide (TPR) repeat protein
MILLTLIALVAAAPAPAVDDLLAGGRNALEVDDPRQALTLYERALAAQPASIEAAVGRATALQESDRTTDALDAWRALAEKHAGRADVQIGLAHALWHKDKRAESGKVLRGLKGTSIRVADLLALARLQTEMSNPAAAVKAATLALAQDPKSAEALMIRADALDWLKKWKRADADADAALKLSDTPRTRYLRGKRAASLNDDQGAVEEYTALLDKAPDHVSARIERARARLDLGEHDNALRDLHAADRKRSGDATIFYLKAKAYHDLDDHLLARDYLLAAKRIDPDDRDVLELLAKVDEKLPEGG